jgi:hypothetical protein
MGILGEMNNRPAILERERGEDIERETKRESGRREENGVIVLFAMKK